MISLPSQTERTALQQKQHLATVISNWRTIGGYLTVKFYQVVVICVTMAGGRCWSGLMTTSLTGRHLVRFSADLRAHRATFSLNDAEYADQILKISLNTFKKCVQPDGDSLSLKRHTLLSVLANAGLNPRSYGLPLALPSQSSPFGGYHTSDYDHLCGRFFLYRRSFLTARNITCSILDIRPSESHDCLTFNELHYYVADGGVRDEIHYDGNVHMNQERSVLSMPAYFEGQVRLTLVQPERLGKSKVKMRGAVLAFGNPKGYWQPTVSGVYVDGPVETKASHPRNLCRTILEGSEEHATLSAELARVEEHTTIMTPLMWAKLQFGAAVA
jgi:hypothetical protein